MLIIERRAGELIQIGDEVQLCVLDTDGETVRLGVSAPRDIAVRAVEVVPTDAPLVEQEETKAPSEAVDDTRGSKPQQSKTLPDA